MVMHPRPGTELSGSIPTLSTNGSLMLVFEVRQGNSFGLTIPHSKISDLL